MKKRKEEAYKTIVPLKEGALEISDEYFVPELTFPKRPPWNYNMTKGVLNLQENKYFNVIIIFKLLLDTSFTFLSFYSKFLC